MATPDYSLLDRIGSRIRPIDNGGEPPDDGRMEVRVAKLENAVDYIQRDIKELKEDVRGIRSDMRVDFRIIFGAIIAVALGLAGLMAKGFHWL